MIKKIFAAIFLGIFLVPLATVVLFFMWPAALLAYPIAWAAEEIFGESWMAVYFLAMSAVIVVYLFLLSFLGGCIT